MSRFRRFEVIEQQLSPSYLLQETSILNSPRTLSLNRCFPIVEEELDLLSFVPAPPLLLDDFDSVSDLIQIHRSFTRRRVARFPELHLQALSDRVSALELGIERLAKDEKREKKYTWTAEIKNPDDDRKYKWTAEKKGSARSYKVTAEIKKKGGIEQTYTVKISRGVNEPVVEKIEKKKKSEKVKGKSVAPRIVEIEERSDHGGIVLRQVGKFCLFLMISSLLG